MSDEDFIVDLREYKDRQGARVPDGRYTVQVTDVDYTTAQSSGNKVIVLYMKILGGEYDGNTLVDRLTQTPNALFRTVNFMRAIKLPTPNKRLKLSKKTLVGRVLEVDVEDGEPYMGTIRSEVRGYLPKVSQSESNGSRQRQSSPEDDDGLEEFAAETTRNPATPARRGNNADQNAEDADETVDDDDDLDLEELSL